MSFQVFKLLDIRGDEVVDGCKKAADLLLFSEQRQHEFQLQPIVKIKEHFLDNNASAGGYKRSGHPRLLGKIPEKINVTIRLRS